MSDEITDPIVVMGVSGSGKTTIGSLLAESLQLPFLDGDHLHSAANVERMAAGIALRDEERRPWLEAVGRHLAEREGRGGVVACSALKRSYRDLLRSWSPRLIVVFLDGPIDLIRSRIATRTHEFMPPTLLASQFASLEPLDPDERGLRVDVRRSPAAVVDEIRHQLLTMAPQTGSTP